MMKTAPIKISSLEKELRALELRKAGYTLERIRQELGVSIGGVALLIKRGIARLEKLSVEGASEYRRLQLERLDEMLSGCWSQATVGDLNAIDRVLKIEERRSRLLGLDDQQPIGVDLQKVEAIVSRLLMNEIDITRAALEVSQIGGNLPEALRIMLSKTPPIMIANSFEVTTTEELDQRALEVMQGIQQQWNIFLPERREEVLALKQELKGIESFNQNNSEEV